ncbi:hypothetical protein AgCh_019361 [Apium graveolens]
MGLHDHGRISQKSRLRREGSKGAIGPPLLSRWEISFPVATKNENLAPQVEEATTTPPGRAGWQPLAEWPPRESLGHRRLHGDEKKEKKSTEEARATLPNRTGGKMEAPGRVKAAE